MSLQGVLTVAKLELRQRMRTSRWPILGAVWFVVVGVATWLTWWALNDRDANAGPALYDVATFFVLGLGMLVVPSLTATSINGDRDQGVLATLQTTLLTAADIVLGKLLAAWAVAMALLAVSLPFLIWAWSEGGLSIGQVLRSLLVLVLVLAIVCAIGLMFSTLTARPVASAVLTYLTMAALVFGTVFSFLLTTVLVTDQQEVKVYGVPESYWNRQPVPEPAEEGRVEDPPTPTVADCEHYTRTESVAHYERIWWMLPMNPFVVVADAAPRGDGRLFDSFTPMAWISTGARAARAAVDTSERDECRFLTDPGFTEDEPIRQGGAVWPYGLAFLVLLGAGSTLVAVKRSQTPVRRLPNGTRIA